MALDIATFMQATETITEAWIWFMAWLGSLSPLAVLALGYLSGRVFTLTTVNSFLSISLKSVWLLVGAITLVVLWISLLAGEFTDLSEIWQWRQWNA